MHNVIVLSTLLLAAGEVTVQPIVGDPATGVIKTLSAEQVIVDVDGKDASFGTQDVLTVTPAKQNPSKVEDARVWVKLLDGSVVAAKQMTIEKRVAKLSLLGGQDVETNTRSFRWVRLKKPTDLLNAKWTEIAEGELEADLLVFRRAADTLDQLDGVILGMTSDKVAFDVKGDEYPVDRERLEGIAYFQASRRKLPSPVCVVTDVHGSRWQVKSLSIEKDEVTMSTVAGVRFMLPLAEVRTFDYSAGNLVYLSDLEPESHQWSPQFGTKVLDLLEKWNEYKRDHGFFTETLPLGDKKGGYKKGLAMFSKTELVYRLTDDYKRFQALVGIDNRYRPNGNVELVITGDGKELLHETITGEMEPLQLNLDISGVRRLRILCGIGAEQQSCDYLIMAEARMTK